MGRPVVIVALWLLLAMAGWGMVRPGTSVTICLNKPGTKFDLPADLGALAKKIGAQRITYIKDPIPCFVIAKDVREIVTRLDLSPWFKNPSCVHTWEDFHRCANQNLDPEDVALVRKIDREFVAKVICQEGSECPCPETMGWRLRWVAPVRMELATRVGEDFTTKEEAMSALAHINEILKKVVYGAEFSYGGTPELYEERPVWRGVDFEGVVERFLMELSPHGMEPRDREAIASMAVGGRNIFYLPPTCGLEGSERSTIVERKGAWVAVEGAVRFTLESNGRCVHWTILR